MDQQQQILTLMSGLTRVVDFELYPSHFFFFKDGSLLFFYFQEINVVFCKKSFLERLGLTKVDDGWSWVDRSKMLLYFFDKAGANSVIKPNRFLIFESFSAEEVLKDRSNG